MKQHPIFPLNLKNSTAKIILIPCPGYKTVEMTLALQQLKNNGAIALVTLMTSSELSLLQLENIGESVKSLGMEWFHLAIEDDCSPESEFLDQWTLVGPQIHQLLNKGNTIAIHCKGGSGRTGLIAGQILLERGENLESVISSIQALRPNAFILNEHQAYIKSREAMTFE